jgi:hypothetical protein
MSTAAKPIPDLMRLIAGNLRDLLQLELTLGKAEATQTIGASKTGVTVILLALAGLLLSMFFGSLAAMFAMSSFLPTWAAALTVACLLLLVSAAAFRIGMRKLKAVDILPVTQTTLKEHLRWETSSKT